MKPPAACRRGPGLVNGPAGWLPFLLTACGVLLILAAMGMKWYAAHGQRVLLQDLDPAGGAAMSDTILLVIPKIELSVAVAEGVDDPTLRYAVGHFEGTAGPGQTGNFCLVGHRNSAFGEFFRRLDEVEPGDPIIVRRGDENYTYVATERLIVKPEDTWVLDATPDARITLITCTGARFALRLVVRGLLGP